MKRQGPLRPNNPARCYDRDINTNAIVTEHLRSCVSCHFWTGLGGDHGTFEGFGSCRRSDKSYCDQWGVVHKKAGMVAYDEDGLGFGLCLSRPDFVCSDHRTTVEVDEERGGP